MHSEYSFFLSMNTTVQVGTVVYPFDCRDWKKSGGVRATIMSHLIATYDTDQILGELLDIIPYDKNIHQKKWDQPAVELAFIRELVPANESSSDSHIQASCKCLSGKG